MALRGALFLVLLLLSQSCAPGEASPRSYPAARWRLATFAQLDNAVLWVSHILVRHQHSSPQDGALRPPAWRPDTRNPQRTRAEAYALASRLLATLRERPEAFEELARRNSDDVTTRDRGGSLGGTRATQLGAPILDAIAAIPVDTPSEIVETSLGFHIVKYRKAPERMSVSGERLVLRYAGDVDETLLGRAGRTREEALRLAHELRESPRPFSELVSRYSEDDSRVLGGDMGVWRTDAPAHNGAELEELSRIPVGSLSQPIDTPRGIVILRRVAVAPREELAAGLVRIDYDPTLDAAAQGSREQARIAAEDALRGERCCDELSQWSAGSGEALLEAAVRETEIGAFVPQAVDIGWQYVVARRVAPVPAAQAALDYRLPSPAEVDLEPFIEHSEGSAVASFVSGLAADIPAQLELGANEASALERILGDLATQIQAASSGRARVDLYRQSQARISRLLDSSTYRRFERFKQEWVVKRLMQLPV